MEHTTKQYELPEDNQPAIVGESAAAQQYAADLKYGMEVLSKVTPEELHHIVVYLNGYAKDEIKDKFDVLFDNWWNETCIYSGPNLCYDNDNFREIKKLGSTVLPFINDKATSEPQYKQRHIEWLRKGILS